MRMFVIIACLLIPYYFYAQGVWSKKASLPSAGRWSAVAFTINNKGYMGTGAGSSFLLDDFWEYDPILDSWTQKANFAGGKRKKATGFSIGNYGYIGTGSDSTNFFNDLWEYDLSNNNWVQVSSMPAAIRETSFGFSIANKGYVGGGSYFNGNFWVYLNDFWEYDPISDSWIKLQNFASGRAEIDRGLFVLNGKAYVGTGSDFNTFHADFWEYTPSGNAWTQKANVPGKGRIGATGFSLCGTGYLGLGFDYPNVLDDFYSYDPASNTWTALNPFPGGPRVDQPSFVINNTAYICSGSSSSTNVFNDLWEFSFLQVTASISPNTSICIGDTVVIMASGGTAYSWNSGETTNSIIVSPTSTTNYVVTVSANCNTATANSTVHVIYSGNAAFSYEHDPCRARLISFFDASSSAMSWCWELGGGGSSTDQNPQWEYPSSGLYSPTLIVNCNTACADTFSIAIPYEIHDTASVLFIPNAFSPNGDGENDSLGFFISDDYCIKQFEIFIYDRWGEKVFESFNRNVGWQGLYKGEKASAGLYNYFCRTTSATGVVTTRKGNISLLR